MWDFTPLADPGAVAQLVRAPDCRSGGCGFESRPRRSLCAWLFVGLIELHPGSLARKQSIVVLAGLQRPHFASSSVVYLSDSNIVRAVFGALSRTEREPVAAT